MITRLIVVRPELAFSYSQEKMDSLIRQGLMSGYRMKNRYLYTWFDERDKAVVMKGAM